MTQWETFLFALITLFWNSWKKIKIFAFPRLFLYLFNSFYTIVNVAKYDYVQEYFQLIHLRHFCSRFLNIKKQKLFVEFVLLWFYTAKFKSLRTRLRSVNPVSLDCYVHIVYMKLPCETLQGKLQSLCNTSHPCYSYFVTMTRIVTIIAYYFVRKCLGLHYLRFAVLDGFTQFSKQLSFLNESYCRMWVFSNLHRSSCQLRRPLFQFLQNGYR